VLINQFQLEKLKKETEAEKRAIIEANIINRDKGERLVKVYNKGKATAKNVIVKFPESANVFIGSYPSPIDIKPQNSIEINVQAYIGSPDTLQIEFEWQDDLRLNNKDCQIIQI
jgi:hypothetical protein